MNRNEWKRKHAVRRQSQLQSETNGSNWPAQHKIHVMFLKNSARASVIS